MNKQELIWLEPLIESWSAGVRQGRAPHALLLAGSQGTGKRCLAAWLARDRLGIGGAGTLPAWPLEIPEHADLRWVSVPEDKQSIGVDQIRELVAEINLTSYEGGSKVAVIEPADAMTVSAANSLLKTLEEPPGDTLIVLVADRPGRLPATIISRCQKIPVRAGDEQAILEWLQNLQPGAQWGRLLQDSGNAPLAAIAALEAVEITDAMAREFAELADGRASPLPVAGRWSDYEVDFVLGWLSRQVQRCIARLSGADAGPAAAPVSDSVLGRMDRRNLFCYLDTINRLRGQPAGSFNVQLTLECLLIDWGAGLRSVTDVD